METIKIFLVEDSNLFRKLMSSVIQQDERYELVGTASNGEVALDKIPNSGADVVLMDINMPVMDGFITVEKARERGIRAVFLALSSLGSDDSEVAERVIRLGATGFVAKPERMLGIEGVWKSLGTKIQSAYETKKRLFPDSSAPLSDQPAVRTEQKAASKSMISVLAGSSGSDKSILSLVPQIPATFTGVTICVCKIPSFFLAQIAKTLADECQVPVDIVTDNMKIRLGRVYIIPIDGNNYVIKLSRATGATFKRQEPGPSAVESPSIDALMKSVSKVFKTRSRGILLSGLGPDGLQGIKEIELAGGEVVVQARSESMAPQLAAAAFERNSGLLEMKIDEMTVLFS